MARSKVNTRILNPDFIRDTIEQLHLRIEDRFPGCGLSIVCQRLLRIAQEAKERSHDIQKPILWVRALNVSLLALILFGLVGTFTAFGVDEMSVEQLGFWEFVQVLEAGINDVVLIGAAIFFLATLENRIKRNKALESLHELRAVAHIIDMHQLTKDPEHFLIKGQDTKHSPKRTMTAFELSRYLDYSSEMLSLCGKVAALYVQEFNDPGALAAVNEIEALTTGLSRKIWQKLMVLNEFLEHKKG